MFVFRTSQTRSSSYVVRRRLDDGAGEYRDGAYIGHPTARNRSAGSVDTWLSGPPRSERAKEEPFFRDLLGRRRNIGECTMAARWSALWTHVRVSGFRLLSVLCSLDLDGIQLFYLLIKSHLGYPVLRAWVGHRYRCNDHSFPLAKVERLRETLSK